MKRLGLALAIALVLSFGLGGPPARAGVTLLEKEYVGGVENKNKQGGGDQSGATNGAARFAGSDNTIAEGPPPGGSGERCNPSAQNPGQADCVADFERPGESFGRGGAILPVLGGEQSVNGYPVFSNVPTCPESGQRGLQGFYAWSFRIERPVVSDIQLQICLDVRKCQEEQDPLGQASTVSIPDFVDADGWEAPVSIRVSHQPGDLQVNPGFLLRTLDDVVNPTLDFVSHPVPAPQLLPDLPSTDRPRGQPILEESVAFIGRDCIIKTVKNDGFIAAHDLITVELSVPSSTRVRVRAAQDSAALCYIGTPLPGEQI